MEADAHRVPAVNVDYARALNLCACIRERAFWTWPFLRRGLKSVQGDRRRRRRHRRQLWIKFARIYL